MDWSANDMSAEGALQQGFAHSAFLTEPDLRISAHPALHLSVKLSFPLITSSA
jgi:hypothetical protein